MSSVDVSASVARFRDAARHLWNCSYLPLLEMDNPRDSRNEWDVRDEFEDVCVLLFDALVLNPAGHVGASMSPAYRGDATPIAELKILPKGSVELRVAESSGNSFRGYDDSLTNSQELALELSFVAFFDYWVLGIREFEYCHAVVSACEERPALVGRNVLIRATEATYELSAP